ncbi:hypothetical protein BDR06DRAFT_976481 [Suillus hirtellus]|nr:hypothetical protein BDR06DRAFT_976481 [Suillus hirtellus]
MPEGLKRTYQTTNGIDWDILLEILLSATIAVKHRTRYRRRRHGRQRNRERMDTPPLVYYVRMNLHWNSGAKTATATVELLERHNISIETRGKHLTISVHLRRSENHKKGGCMVQQHLYDGYRALYRVKMRSYLHVNVATCDYFGFVSLASCEGGISNDVSPAHEFAEHDKGQTMAFLVYLMDLASSSQPLPAPGC